MHCLENKSRKWWTRQRQSESGHVNLSGCCWCLVYPLFSLHVSITLFSLCPLSPFLSTPPPHPFLLIHFIPLAFPFLPALPFSHLLLLPSLLFHSLSFSITLPPFSSLLISFWGYPELPSYVKVILTTSLDI